MQPGRVKGKARVRSEGAFGGSWKDLYQVGLPGQVWLSELLGGGSCEPIFSPSPGLNPSGGRELLLRLSLVPDVSPTDTGDQIRQNAIGEAGIPGAALFSRTPGLEPENNTECPAVCSTQVITVSCICGTDPDALSDPRR